MRPMTRPALSMLKPGSFAMAASIAFKDGMRKASPALLEPMMAVEVETPEDFMGNVVGDLSSRRGMIQGMDDMPTGKVVKAEVPLAEMFGYSTVLRSLTQGKAEFTMEFARYLPAPSEVQKELEALRVKGEIGSSLAADVLLREAQLTANYQSVLDERAKDVPKAELDEYLKGGYGIFGGAKVTWAKLRFSPLAARWVATQQWHSKQKSETEKDGSYILSLPYSNDALHQRLSEQPHALPQHIAVLLFEELAMVSELFTGDCLRLTLRFSQQLVALLQRSLLFHNSFLK